MALHRQNETFLDKFRRGSPLAWVLVFVVAMPWLRLRVAGWELYPLFWLLSLVLGLALVRSRAVGRRAPLKPLLALGAYLCLMAALREQWTLLVVMGAGLAACACWGWAAYRVGMASGGTGSIPDGLLLLLAATLAMGAVSWAATAYWPPLCLVLNCPQESLPPYVFLGGWANHDQYLLYLVLTLPVAAVFLLLLHRNPRTGRGALLLGALLGACAMALLAGASWWMLLLLAAGACGAVWRLLPLARPGDGAMARGMVLTVLLGAMVVYGLSPAYLGLAVRGAVDGGELRVEYVDSPPPRLYSSRTTLLRLRIENSGLLSLPRDPSRKLILGARLLVTPRQGITRAYDAARVELPGPLPPGRAVEVVLPVRLPHWAREGYLSWRPAEFDKQREGGNGAPENPGRAVRLAEDSRLGFRFINGDYRSLEKETANYLSALARRAREFGRDTFAPGATGRDPRTAGNLLGRTLDTMLFSPLWGLPSETDKRVPFSGGGPFWVQLFQQYGLFALAPALWIGLVLLRRMSRIARHGIRLADRLLWRLLPLSVLLATAMGLFSSVLGELHGIWGLFLLSGYVEGRYRHLFAQRLETQPARPPRRWFAWKRRRRRAFPTTRTKLRSRWHS